jgi:hypothetical protein
METWLIVLIVAGIVAIAVVAIGALIRARKRRQSSASIGLPPLGAVSADGPITSEAAPGTTQSSETAKVSDHRSH